MSYSSTNCPNDRTAHLTESERHSLLAAERRRLVLDILEGQTTPLQLADLASEIAEQETGLNAEDTETVEDVKITLHHNHLPKMDELGVLEYDMDSNQIRPQEATPVCETSAMASKEAVEIDVEYLLRLDTELDTLFDVLSHSRRRAVLSCLHEYTTPITLADVADEVATLEDEITITEIPAEKVKSIYLSLYHSHIPQMENLGIIKYSQERDAVALTEDGEKVTSNIGPLSLASKQGP